MFFDGIGLLAFLWPKTCNDNSEKITLQNKGSVLLFFLSFFLCLFWSLWPKQQKQNNKPTNNNNNNNNQNKSKQPQQNNNHGTPNSSEQKIKDTPNKNNNNTKPKRAKTL